MIKTSIKGGFSKVKHKKLLFCFVAALLVFIQVNTPVLAASKESKAAIEYTKKDVKLLACLIYTESGNQSYKGKVAVGNVILNRMKNRTSFNHVNTIKEVIYDKKWAVQFGVTVGGANSPISKALKNYSTLKNKDQMKSCIKAAKAVLNGKNVVDNRLYFTGYSKNLAKKHPNYMKIGAHIFY